MAVKTYYYTDGNTVRESVSEAQYIEEQRIIKERRQKRKELKLKQHASEQKRVYKNSVAYSAYMIIAVVAMVACFIAYVYFQASISATMREISTIQTEISDLKADNKAASNRINSTANLKAVKEIAENNLGMVYATKDQIVYYSVSENDYIEQYDSVK